MKILVVVDMQNDFIDGALGTPEAVNILPRVVERITRCAKDPQYAIFYTRDTHFDNYLDTAEGRKLPVPHCIVNTHGWQINSQVWEASKDFKCVDVQNKCTFGMEDIAELLFSLTDVCDDYVDYDTWDVESIEIIGLCTDICVISNALILKASYPDIPITVYADSCAGVTPAKHEAALEVMRSCQIDVI